MIVRIYDIVSATNKKKPQKKPRKNVFNVLFTHRNRHTDTDICKRYNFAE